MQLKSKFPERAFTLIEIMVSIVIFSIVVAAIYSTWTVVIRSREVGQEAAAQVQRQRVAIHTIENALTCIQSFQASMQYYSFIVSNGDPAMLSFTARLPNTFPRSGKFGDFHQRRLTFSVEAGPDSEKDLVLRQNPILMDMDSDEQSDPLVLARGVKDFIVECWDTNTLDWDTEWDDTNSIPPMLRVTLTLAGTGNADNNLSPQYIVTRDLAIPSETMPTVVQMPRGGGGGGGGGGNKNGFNKNGPGGGKKIGGQNGGTFGGGQGFHPQ